MKQKIVMKVHMNCQKCRTKALKVVAAASGVNFVGLEGEEKDKLVVIGDEVDPVKLTNSLRKKVGHTDIISLAELFGVNSVNIEGESKDRVVVIGEDVDAANLTSCMRKKVGHTELVTIVELKGK
ncbi:hypothetical protein JHK87_042056 [Glycine soja]|nr:hypothetical protein JHK87_042056 [Glycine soja]